MPFRPKNSRFWHYDFQIRGCRFHGSCGTEDFETAKAIEAQARVSAKAAQTAAPAPGVFTLSEALGTYCADVAEHQPSARTTRAQAKAMLAILPPATRLPDLTMAMVQGYVSRRRATCANGTVNRELQLMGRALRHMARIHRAQLPADLHLKSLEVAEAEERIRELSAEEQARLFDHLRPDLHPLVTLALATGLRVSELCGLQWQAVDLGTGRIRFTQKGGRTRHFPINAELRAILSSLPRADTLPHAKHVLTYINHKAKGHPRHRLTQGGGLMEKFREAVDTAQIPDFRFHDLRHTFATRLLRQTGNLKLVSRLLGHTQIETTMRYAHVLDDDLRQALDGYTVKPLLHHKEQLDENACKSL
jgi:integrase